MTLDPAQDDGAIRDLAGRAERGMARLREGLASELDNQALAQATSLGMLRVSTASGDRAVSVAGLFSNSPIITGTSIAIKIEDESLLEAMLKRFYLPRLFQLPRVVRGFKDRDDHLEALTRAVKESGFAIIGIFPDRPGADGVGKTELAVKLAHTLADRSVDAQIMFRMNASTSEARSIREAQTHVVKSFHPEATMPEDTEQCTGSFRSVLHGRRVLLLIDDVPADAAQLVDLVPPEPCLLIFTARTPRISLDGQQRVDLGGLPQSAAEELLLDLAAHIGEQASTIATLCERIPRALRCAGSTLAVFSKYTPSKYVERLQEERVTATAVEASLNLKRALMKEWGW
jgi:hypothetical protein